jgi:hypothetical protein
MLLVSNEYVIKILSESRAIPYTIKMTKKESNLSKRVISSFARIDKEIIPKIELNC